jgi:hypothetical protein
VKDGVRTGAVLTLDQEIEARESFLASQRPNIKTNAGPTRL